MAVTGVAGARNPVLLSIAVAVGLGVLLMTVAAALPLRANVDHAVAHLSLAVPLLVLLASVLWSWPPLGAGGTARLVRLLLIGALAIFSGGLVLEALGAFGYAEDQMDTANDLVVLHAIGNGVWPLGFIGTVAAGLLTIAVTVADQRGHGGSRLLLVAWALAVLVVIGFHVGSLIFGY